MGIRSVGKVRFTLDKNNSMNSEQYIHIKLAMDANIYGYYNKMAKGKIVCKFSVMN